MMIRLEIGSSIMSLVNILFGRPPVPLETPFPTPLYRKCHTLFLPSFFPYGEIS